jgi:hypothetical protein
MLIYPIPFYEYLTAGAIHIYDRGATNCTKPSISVTLEKVDEN